MSLSGCSSIASLEFNDVDFFEKIRVYKSYVSESTPLHTFILEAEKQRTLFENRQHRKLQRIAPSSNLNPNSCFRQNFSHKTISMDSEIEYRAFTYSKDRFEQLCVELKKVDKNSPKAQLIILELQALYEGLSNPFVNGINWKEDGAQGESEIATKFKQTVKELPEISLNQKEELFDMRVEQLQRMRDLSCPLGKTVAIEGGGPVGLLHAIAAYLKGADRVTVIEKRQTYTRNYYMVILAKDVFAPWVNLLGLDAMIPYLMWVDKNEMLGIEGASCIVPIADLERALKRIVESLGIEMVNDEVTGLDENGYLSLKERGSYPTDVVIAAGGRQSAASQSLGIRHRNHTKASPLIAIGLSAPIDESQNIEEASDTAVSGVQLHLPRGVSTLSDRLLWLAQNRQERYLLIPLIEEIPGNVSKLTLENKLALGKTAATAHGLVGRAILFAEIFNNTVAVADMPTYYANDAVQYFVVGDAAQQAAPETGFGLLAGISSVHHFSDALGNEESGPSYIAHIQNIHSILVEKSKASRKAHSPHSLLLDVSPIQNVGFEEEDLEKIVWILRKREYDIPLSSAEKSDARMYAFQIIQMIDFDYANYPELVEIANVIDSDIVSEFKQKDNDQCAVM